MCIKCQGFTFWNKKVRIIYAKEGKMYDVDTLIAKRKEKWYKNFDLDDDLNYRNLVADYMQREPEGRKAIKNELAKYPEKLIELFMVIVDKDQKTVPFFLNDVQIKLKDILNKAFEDFQKGLRNHLMFLLLKGRQQGFTQFITAYQLAWAITHRNFAGFTLADNADNTEVIFTDKAKFPFDKLPEYIQPTQKYNNRRELHFQKFDASGLNSRMRISTAGARDVGRSKTLNFFHGSECAFWKDINSILTGLGEALTRNCVSILETTANGFNAYKTLWDDDNNNWEKLFFSWWDTKEYRMNFESPLHKKAFIKAIKDSIPNDDAESEQWCLARLKWLRQDKLVDLEQAYWYYSKWKDIRGAVRQEYPCNPKEAFLSTGKNYFDVAVLDRRLAKLKKENKVIAQGFFEYEYTTEKYTKNKVIDTETISWIDNVQGEIKVFLEPSPKMPFVMGADTASDGTDNNIAQVIDRNGLQYATCKVAKDEDLFAEQMYCLGWYYNSALIVPEVNHSTHPTKMLLERGYPNVYVRGRADAPVDMAQHIQPRYGFRTDMNNRPSMLGLLRQLVRDNPEYINDIDTINEMLSFVRDDTGKPTAEVGEHDDRVIAYAIALQTAILTPDELKIPAKELKGYYTETELEDLGYSRYQIKEYLAGRMTLYKDEWRYK